MPPRKEKADAAPKKAAKLIEVVLLQRYSGRGGRGNVGETIHLPPRIAQSLIEIGGAKLPGDEKGAPSADAPTPGEA